MRVLAFGDPLWGDASNLALYRSKQGHEVRTAGPSGNFDYLFEPGETTAEFVARVGAEWEPDILYFGFPEMYPPPRDVERSPVPTVAAISDWNLYGPQLAYNLCRFDVVLSDLHATQRLKVHGITPQHLTPLYSHRTHIHRRIDRPRDIDVLFLGNLNHAIHHERGLMLEHLARNADGYRLVIDSGLPPEDYALRMNEAKIVVNYGVRGEMNLRSFEAPACGALLFTEENNLEVFDWLDPWEECVPYSPATIDKLIAQFLGDEDERARVAEAGCKRIRQIAAEERLDFLFGWMGKVNLGERAFDGLPQRRRALADAMLYGSSPDEGQRAYSRMVLVGLRERNPEDAEVLLACGCSAYDHATALGGTPAQRDLWRTYLREAIGAFNAAHAARPDEAIPLLNLALLSRQAGIEVSEESFLKKALDAPRTSGGAYWIGKVTDPFYAGWRLGLGMGEERTGLLRAAAHVRLAELYLSQKDPRSALIHGKQAIQHAPDLAAPYTIAGRAALAVGEAEEAVALLRAGLPKSSFDVTHRQALVQALQLAGKTEEAADLRAESRKIFGVCVPLAGYAALFDG